MILMMIFITQMYWINHIGELITIIKFMSLMNLILLIKSLTLMKSITLMQFIIEMRVKLLINFLTLKKIDFLNILRKQFIWWTYLLHFDEIWLNFIFHQLDETHIHNEVHDVVEIYNINVLNRLYWSRSSTWLNWSPSSNSSSWLTFFFWSNPLMKSITLMKLINKMIVWILITFLNLTDIDWLKYLMKIIYLKKLITSFWWNLIKPDDSSA